LAWSQSLWAGDSRVTGHMKPTVEGFSKVLGGSVILHIIIIALGAYLFSGSAKKVFTPVYTVDLVAPGPRAKTTSEKKATAAPLPVAAPEPVITPEPAAAPEPVIKTEPVKVKTAAEPEKKAAVKKEAARETVKIKQEVPAREPVSISDRIKEIAKKKEREQEQELLTSRIEELKKQQEARSEAVARRVDDIKKQIASKPQTAAGATPAGQPARDATQGGGGGPSATGTRIGFAGSSGITSENLQTKYREYYNIIKDRIDEHWVYPKGFEYEKISVIVSIRIDRNGNLISSWLEESSGHRRFDDSLLSATKKASPFPPLPVDFEGNFLEVGLRFCPTCKD